MIGVKQHKINGLDQLFTAVEPFSNELQRQQAGIGRVAQ